MTGQLFRFRTVAHADGCHDASYCNSTKNYRFSQACTYSIFTQDCHFSFLIQLWDCAMYWVWLHFVPTNSVTERRSKHLDVIRMEIKSFSSASGCSILNTIVSQARKNGIRSNVDRAIVRRTKSRGVVKCTRLDDQWMWPTIARSLLLWLKTYLDTFLLLLEAISSFLDKGSHLSNSSIMNITMMISNHQFFFVALACH